MELKQGTLLQGGKYKIEATLGQGTFGITYLGTAPVTPPIVEKKVSAKSNPEKVEPVVEPKVIVAPTPPAPPKKPSTRKYLLTGLIVVLLAFGGFSINANNTVVDIPQPANSTLDITVNGVTFTMVRVEGGTFMMGATDEQEDADYDEKPAHQVTLSDYYIGQTEVTQALWEAVMGETPTSSGYQWEPELGLGDNYPAYYINYNDVLSFIAKLNSLTGRTFRMPTEAEWEYAARGGNKGKGYLYSGGNTLDNVGWCWDNINRPTHSVAQKSANELGIYDMSGNVWEWCSDWNGTYSSSSQTNPTGPSTGSLRVLRGGSWADDATCCRVAYRGSISPSFRSYDYGVRLALSSSH